MDFFSSIKRNMTTAAYAQFDGRASRSEYWWFYLFTLLGLMAEYIGLIYEEVKQRPNFVVRTEVGFDKNKHNRKPDDE